MATSYDGSTSVMRGACYFLGNEAFLSPAQYIVSLISSIVPQPVTSIAQSNIPWHGTAKFSRYIE